MHALLALQRSAGNQAVTRHLARLHKPEESIEQRLMLASVEDMKQMLEETTVTEERVKIKQRLREALMFTLANGRLSLMLQMQAAADEETRRQRRLELRAFDAPLLADIRKYTILAAQRYHHEDPQVQDGVLAAVQLEAVANAEGRLAAPKDAHEKAYKAAGMAASDEWCGFFAMEQYMRSDLDSDVKRGFFHVTNVEHYFTYKYAFGPVKDTRVMKWIYADESWHDLRAYHQARGSVRTWLGHADIQAADTPDIRPGDLVLIDNRDTPAADHIVMVHSFDATTNTLYTIGGNDSGYQVDTGANHKAGNADQQDLEGATGQPLKPGGGNHSVAVNAYDVKRVPQVRIYGIGRPSLVDFEDHRYDSTNPKHPPTG